MKKKKIHRIPKFTSHRNLEDDTQRILGMHYTLGNVNAYKKVLSDIEVSSRLLLGGYKRTALPKVSCILGVYHYRSGYAQIQQRLSSRKSIGSSI